MPPRIRAQPTGRRPSKSGAPGLSVGETRIVEVSGEQWVTRDEVLAARLRYESAIPGWRCPRLYGLGVRKGHGDIWFPFICHGDHPLPAAVLATVCGHRSGSASYEMTVDQLDDAIRRLAPAEACTDWDHPNLAAWRQVRRSLGAEPDWGVVAVFDADPGSPSEASDVLTLRRQAGTISA